MHFFRNSFLLAAGSAQLSHAHTAFCNTFLDGVNQGPGTALRMSNNMGQATFPITSVTSPDVACGRSSKAVRRSFLLQMIRDVISHEPYDNTESKQVSTVKLASLALLPPKLAPQSPSSGVPIRMAPSPAPSISATKGHVLST